MKIYYFMYPCEKIQLNKTLLILRWILLSEVIKWCEKIFLRIEEIWYCFNVLPIVFNLPYFSLKLLNFYIPSSNMICHSVILHVSFVVQYHIKSYKKAMIFHFAFSCHILFCKMRNILIFCISLSVIIEDIFFWNTA